MLGLKIFATAAITIRGIELMLHIHKEQFDLRTLATQGPNSSENWAGVLIALQLAVHRQLNEAIQLRVLCHRGMQTPQ